MKKRISAIGYLCAAVAVVGAPFVLGVIHSPAARAQSTETSKEHPKFEVASVKLSEGGPGSSIGMDRSGNFTAKNMSLLGLIAQAYRVQNFQVYGAPSWSKTETYDIVAKPEAAGPPPGAGQLQTRWAGLQLRLQGLLEERFGLHLHRETRELPVLDLVVAKGGIKLQPSDCVTVDPMNPPARTPSGERPRFCGNLGQHREGTNNILNGYGNDIAGIVTWLSAQTSRTVIDKTGYTNKFNITLEWSPDLPATDPDNPAPGTSGPSLFTALQEQAGLKLQNSKGPVEVLVIEHVDHPTGN